MPIIKTTEPAPDQTSGKKKSNAEQTCLDKSGFNFINKCVSALERRGLTDEGLYRVGGVASEVVNLLTIGLDINKLETVDLTDKSRYQTSTITSAIKKFFHNMPEPIMTYDLHSAFITAGRLENCLEFFIFYFFIILRQVGQQGKEAG